MLIEGQDKFHYALIKYYDYDRMLSFDSYNDKVFCPYCCCCQIYGPQRTDILKEGKNIIKFKEIQKMQKLSFCINADF